MTHDMAIKELEEYMQIYLFEPGANWSEYYFKERSYSRWAANEILTRLKEERKLTPVEITEEFISEMDDFSCMNKNPDSKLIFSIARDRAKDILCLFLF